jgi:hypothetical protein
MNQPRSLLSILIDFLRGIFGKPAPTPAPQPTPNPTPPAPTPAPGPVVPAEPAQITSSRVLLIIYNPIVEPALGIKLSQKLQWNDPDQLSAEYINDILETSGGMARYQIVERVEVHEFPQKVDGYTYDWQTYLDVLRGVTPPRQPEMVSYSAILSKFNLLQRVANNEIDEVWVFAFPHAGMYESVMAGSGAFWCNASPLGGTSQCPRRFVIMGFSYERGVGEMLENFGHRTESIMEQTFSKTGGAANLWKKFIRYDLSHPGQAEVGNIHFAPNSERDYDWGNMRLVPSRCDDWYNFPNFQNTVRQVNADEWGNGDIRAHHKWWLKHLPRVAGRTNGIAHNWWQYVIDPNKVS